MAYDEQLADRIREALSARPEVVEKKMFGGIAFMVAGNMAVGVLGGDLIVRLGHDDAAAALGEEGVRAFDFTGRPSKTMVYVEPERTAADRDLAQWVEAGADYAASLAAN